MLTHLECTDHAMDQPCHSVSEKVVLSCFGFVSYCILTICLLSVDLHMAHCPSCNFSRASEP